MLSEQVRASVGLLAKKFPVLATIMMILDFSSRNTSKSRESKQGDYYLSLVMAGLLTPSTTACHRPIGCGRHQITTRLSEASTYLELMYLLPIRSHLRRQWQRRACYGYGGQMLT